MKIYVLLFVLPCFVLAMENENKNENGCDKKTISSTLPRSFGSDNLRPPLASEKIEPEKENPKKDKQNEISNAKLRKTYKKLIVIQGYLSGKLTKEEFDKIEALKDGEKETKDFIEIVPFGSRPTKSKADNIIQRFAQLTSEELEKKELLIIPKEDY